LKPFIIWQVKLESIQQYLKEKLESIQNVSGKAERAFRLEGRLSLNGRLIRSTSIDEEG